MKRILTAFTLSAFLTSPAWSGCEVDISDYVGWQIIHSGTVTGYIDDNGVEQDSFEGCEWGRQLIIDYSLAVTCATYNYSSAHVLCLCLYRSSCRLWVQGNIERWCFKIGIISVSKRKRLNARLPLNPAEPFPVLLPEELCVESLIIYCNESRIWWLRLVVRANSKKRPRKKRGQSNRECGSSHRREIGSSLVLARPCQKKKRSAQLTTRGVADQ